MAKSEDSKLGIGLAIGAAIGAVTAFFFSPRSGKENRDMVVKKLADLKIFIDEQEIDEKAKEIFGEVSATSKKMYVRMQKETKTRIGDLQEAIEKIDIDSYKTEVEKIVKALKKDFESSELVDKAQKYLMSFVQKIKSTDK